MPATASDCPPFKALHHRSVAANAMSASSLLACFSDAAREGLEEVVEGASVSCDPRVVLEEAIEAILKVGLKPIRYQVYTIHRVRMSVTNISAFVGLRLNGSEARDQEYLCLQRRLTSVGF